MLKTALEVAAYVTFISAINQCQDKLKRTATYLENVLCYQKALAPEMSLNLMHKKIKSVVGRPVTVWGMINVSKGLVLGTCSSILTFSVLFVQIDNGLLKTAVKNSTK